MPPRKNNYKKKYRKRKTFNKKRYSRAGNTRRSKLSDATVYSFKRSIQLSANITGSASSDTFGALSFHLDQLPAYTEFQTLFDQYKISGVSLRFIPQSTSVEIASGDSANVFVYCPDYDDQGAPTTAAALYQRQSTKFIYSAHKTFKMFLRPNTLVSVENGFGPGSRRQWVSTNDASVTYYGFKWCMRQATIPQHIDVYATYYLKFKNVK